MQFFWKGSWFLTCCGFVAARGVKTERRVKTEMEDRGHSHCKLHSGICLPALRSDPSANFKI